MKLKIALIVSAIPIVALLAATVAAQTSPPSYLAEMPSVERVTQAMQANDPDETAARQMGAFWQLKVMIEEMAGPRYYAKQGLTPEETKLRQAYYTAYYQISQSKPQYKSFVAMRGYDVDPKFRNELIQKLFPPAFASEYAKTMGQAKSQNQAFHNQAEQARAQQAAKEQAEGQKAYNKLQQDYEAGKFKAPPSPAERAQNRCIAAGRLPQTCLGNTLLGGLGQFVGQFIPAYAKQPEPGLVMAGVFQGQGNWRVDFLEQGVLVNCSFLSPNQEFYTVEVKNGHTLVTINTTPKPLVLTLTAEGNLVGPGPIVIDGVVPGGYVNGTDNAMYQDTSGNRYDAAGNKAIATDGYTTFASKRTTCSAQNLSSKGAGEGVETMGKNLLNMALGGGNDAPVPAGLRVRGSYIAQTGFSLEFYPESVIVGCGEPARAYPYEVLADGAESTIKIEDSEHPLLVKLKSDGSIDAGSGSYLVHGRRIVGSNENGDYQFAPLEATCNLGRLVPGAVGATPANAAPTSASVGSAASNGTATASTSPGTPGSAGVQVTIAGAPTGSAVLSITSGLRSQPNSPNPLGTGLFVLMRDSVANLFSKAGIQVPAGSTAQLVQYNACSQHTPECQKMAQAFHGNVAAAVRPDALGKATFAGVPPGTYFVIASTTYNNQKIYWELRVDLKAGSNAATLDEQNGKLLYPNSAAKAGPAR